MKKANLDIRKLAKDSGVYLWQIAEALGIQESNFCKALRSELSDSEKEKIYSVIEQLAEGE